jgi:capsular exopolysaccharide synthesis family protein
LLLSKAGSPPKSIVITSAIPGEGKTTASVSLAIELAGMGRRVLLVDADFRRRSLSKTFGFDQVTGLSTFLAGGKLQVETTTVPNLSVLPAGTVPPNPAGLLNSTRFEEAMRSLEASYHMVLVDAPPVLSVADAGVLAAKCGAVVFVVDAEATPDELVRQALARISRTGCTILGGVVNKVDIRQTSYRSYTKYYYDEKYTSKVAATD